MTTGDRVCGRLTRKGTPCRRELHWWREGLETRHADGCWRHMGSSFKEAAERRKQADEAAWLAYLYADPICWSWPVPNDLGALTLSQGETLDERLIEQALGPLGSSPESRASAMLVRWQDGRCAICGHRRGLVEDHDHSTGMSRGYLCHGCNIQEGIYRAPDTLFGKYRERHPTKILGLQIRYWDPIAKDYALPRLEQTEADKWIDAASEDIL